MLRHVAAFEWRYQLKSPVFWVGCLIFFLLTFASVVIPDVQIGSRGNVNVNSPYALLQTTALMTLFSIFVIVAMVANVVIRDDETGFATILRSTSVSKASYLVGRFAGANLAALLVIAAVPLAVALGALMPNVDAEKVGPFHLRDYAYTLFAFALPTLLIISAAFFALATATRSMMSTYIGAVGALVLYSVMKIATRDPQYDTIAALSDPFGISAFFITTKYWTAADRNTQLPALTGLLLANRVLWTGVALALFAVAYRAFHFEQRTTGAPRRARGQRSQVKEEGRSQAAPGDMSDAGHAPAGTLQAAHRAVSLPTVQGRATRWQQLLLLARFDMAFVFKSPAFFVLLGLGLFNAVASMWMAGEYYGSPAYPVTRLMVQALSGAYSMIPIIVAVFYAGELVWRDRDRRMHEIVDATSAPDWTHLVPKVLAIALVLFTTALVGVAGGMLVQTLHGYTHYQLGAYLLWFVVPTTISAVQLAVLAVVVQVLVPQKYIGWGLMLLYAVATVALATAGFEHNLYLYGGSPQVPLSDMNGMGRFWIGAAWFQLYWSAFALMLAVVAHLLWRRGANVALKPRLKQLRHRLHGAPIAWLALGTVVWVGSGAWIFYNTNMLNEYVTQPQREALLARLEKELLPFEKLPQPKIRDVKLDVQVYPRETRVVTQGQYVLENASGRPIDVLHIRYFNPATTLDRLEFPGATLQKDYTEYHYRIYKLQPAMQPGEKRVLQFTTTVQQRGFANSAQLTRVVANGTFLDNREIAPGIGMDRGVLMRDRSTRRKHGLPADLRVPKLEDDSGRGRSEFSADSDWVTADITVTTDADQTPMAPGYTVSDTTANGRRTVHFKPDAPLNNFFSIQSARYAVQRDQWNGVDLAVYYDPQHPYNVPRMLKAMKLALQTYSERFSPYQFRQARVLEFPDYPPVFAQSFANTIPYSEDIGFLFHHTDANKIDMVTYVTAHEIAHQWWGHQIVGANQQGSAMLAESFAQYSALLVMEKMYGPEQVRRFLKYELDRYLRDRGGEAVEELPLDRVEEQGYIHYRKATVVMYTLRDVIGEEKVSRAMRRLLQQYAFKAAPYPNTRDFIKLLREEAGPQYDQLITDLLEKITLLDLKATEATAKKRADGKYEVTLDIDARKVYADGQGKETEAPMNEPLDIGVFTARPGDADFNAKSVLHFQREAIHSGHQTVSVVVDREPKFAGVDPYNKWVDRNSDDNLHAVTVQ